MCTRGLVPLNSVLHSLLTVVFNRNAEWSTEYRVWWIRPLPWITKNCLTFNEFPLKAKLGALIPLSLPLNVKTNAYACLLKHGSGHWNWSKFVKPTGLSGWQILALSGRCVASEGAKNQLVLKLRCREDS